MSTALDRQLYLRLLVQCMMHGEPDYGPQWRHELKIPGILVTDAKGLYDHLRTTGSMPKERQTLIDLLVARDLIEAGSVKLRWVPQSHMLADPLTKNMKTTPVFDLLHERLLHALVQTPEGALKETRRSEQRQGQRQRRKARDRTRAYGQEQDRGTRAP